MAEFLVIHLGERIDDLAHWIAVDNMGARLSPPVVGPLAEVIKDAHDRKVIVLVPGVEVLTTSVDIPIKSKSRIQAALPFALEEFLADDVENLHFAPGSRQSNERIPVSVVRRDKLREWIDSLSQADIVPSSIIADNQGLARIPGTISLLLTENQTYINDGNETDLVLQGLGPREGLMAIGALDTARSEEDDDNDDDELSTIPRHVLVYCEPGEEERYSNELTSIQLEFDSLDLKILPDGILPRLAVTVGTGAGINLLQGEFGPKAEYASLLRPWKYAAILLLAFGATMMTKKLVDYYQLGVLESELQEQFLTDYREIVPGATDVRDPAGAVSSLQSQTGVTVASELMLESLEQLSRAIQRNQEAHNEAISYRDGVVDVRLSAPNVSVLDNIQQSIDEGGMFEARILSTDQDGEVVNSRIQIQVNGA
jgi:general secretion pathway protein L